MVTNAKRISTNEVNIKYNNNITFEKFRYKYDKMKETNDCIAVFAFRITENGIYMFALKSLIYGREFVLPFLPYNDVIRSLRGFFFPSQIRIN